MKKFVTSVALSIFRWSARTRLKRSRAKVVGVTGSVGKSSCLYLLDRVLKTKLKVKTTWQGNSQTGIPLEILDLRSDIQGYHWWQWLIVLFKAPFRAFVPLSFDVVVIEMGIDSPFPPNNMSFLLKLVVPDIGVFLEVSPTHTEQFAAVIAPEKQSDPQAYIQAIALEKGKLVTYLPRTKTAVINRDNTAITQLVPKIQATLATFGTQAKNTVQYTGWTVNRQGTVFTFTVGEKQYRYATKTILSEAYGMTIAATLTVAKVFDIPLQEAIASLEDKVNLPPSRLGVFDGKKGITIVDSTYNASPKAMLGLLSLLSRLTPKPQRVVVVGDMRELGPLARGEHEKVARELAKTGDRIILVGQQMIEWAVPVFATLDFPKKNLACFATSEGVGDYVLTIVQKGDVVLVKGSQNTIFLETVVVDLLAHITDRKDVCRQSAYWEKVRANFFLSHPNKRVV